MPQTIEVPYSVTEGDETWWNRRKAEVRSRHGLSSDHYLTLRRIAVAAQEAGATLGSGQPVTRPEDAITLLLELVEAAAAE